MSYNPTPENLIFTRGPRNEEEREKYANALYNEGHYPAGLDGCFCVGIAGDCGTSCYIYKEGKCEIYEEIWNKRKNKMTEEEIEEYKRLYLNKEDK